MTVAEPRAADAGQRWRRAEPMLWRRTLDGVVVLPAREECEPIALRGPAAGIWELLDRPMTTTDIVTVLAAEYGVAEAQVAHDIGSSLDLLLELGALWRS